MTETGPRGCKGVYSGGRSIGVRPGRPTETRRFWEGRSGAVSMIAWFRFPDPGGRKPLREGNRGPPAGGVRASESPFRRSAPDEGFAAGRGPDRRRVRSERGTDPRVRFRASAAQRSSDPRAAPAEATTPRGPPGSLGVARVNPPAGILERVAAGSREGSHPGRRPSVGGKANSVKKSGPVTAQLTSKTNLVLFKADVNAGGVAITVNPARRSPQVMTAPTGMDQPSIFSRADPLVSACCKWEVRPTQVLGLARQIVSPLRLRWLIVATSTILDSPESETGFTSRPSERRSLTNVSIIWRAISPATSRPKRSPLVTLVGRSASKNVVVHLKGDSFSVDGDVGSQRRYLRKKAEGAGFAYQPVLVFGAFAFRH